jgi:hypothetical protein
MDMTGVRPYQSSWRLWNKVRGIRGSSWFDNEYINGLEPGHGLFAGLDHDRYWHGGHRRYLVTTEPYGADNAAKAVTLAGITGWTAHVLPDCIGFHLPDGKKGTHLVLMSPPGGVEIEPLVPKLIEVMPRWKAPYEKAA